MISVLFSLVKSPFESNEIHTMDCILGDNKGGVLLFEDSVYYATNEKLREKLIVKKYSIYAIAEELEARGYQNLSVKGVEVIDYARAAELIMESYDKVISL